MTRSQFLAGAAGVLLAGPLVARGGKPTIKPGIAPETARRLRDQAAKSWRQRLTDLTRRRAQAFGPLQRLAAEVQPRVVAAFDKRPEARAVRAELDKLAAEQKRVDAIADGLERQAARAKLQAARHAFERRYLAVYQAAWDASGVDIRRLDEAMLRTLGAYSPAKYQRLGPASHRMALADESDPVPPQTAFEFAAPYTHEIEDSEGGALHVVGAYANKETPLSGSLAVSMVAGGCEARGAVGIEITVPAGYRRLKVTANYIQDHYNNGGSFLGATGSGTGFVLELHGADENVLSKEFETGNGWAALAWSFSEEHAGDRRKTTTFNIPNGGGEYLALAGSYSWAWAGGPGGSVGSTWDTPTSIKVEILG